MHTVAAFAALVLALVTPAAQQPPELVARSLVPLLRDARASQQPELAVAPGSLPPSPIAGRNSTLVAVTIGRRTVPLEPEVEEAIDRLLSWDVREPLPQQDRALVADWLEELRTRISRRLAEQQPGAGCNDQCLVEQLTNPGPLFGDSPEAQVDGRNELLLDALTAVVKE